MCLFMQYDTWIVAFPGDQLLRPSESVVCSATMFSRKRSSLGKDLFCLLHFLRLIVLHNQPSHLHWVWYPLRRANTELDLDGRVQEDTVPSAALYLLQNLRYVEDGGTAATAPSVYPKNVQPCLPIFLSRRSNAFSPKTKDSDAERSVLGHATWTYRHPRTMSVALPPYVFALVRTLLADLDTSTQCVTIPLLVARVSTPERTYQFGCDPQMFIIRGELPRPYSLFGRAHQVLADLVPTLHVINSASSRLKHHAPGVPTCWLAATLHPQ